MRSIAALLTVLFASFGISRVAASQSGPVVATDSGGVQGTVENGLAVWRGIPFAAAPVGRLRWREPEAPSAWPGIRRAGRFSPICMQRGMYPPDAPGEPESEDCLYLNIWAPAGTSPSSLPVMVWIYGGGLENGSALTPLYAGDRLATKRVVVVTFNYRLGVFGFLAHPELSRESAHKGSGNYGLLDQIAALRWVRRNIAGFGGDPERVTVFGQSSGSISLSILTASPLARGLFERAIGESGGLFEPVEISSDYKLPGAEDEGRDFVRRAHAASIAKLREMPARRLLAIPFGPHPVLDGYVLRDSPYDVYRAGLENPVTLLIGSNADEGAFFLAGRKIDPQDYREQLSGDFPAFLVDLLAPSPGHTPLSARAAAAAFEGDIRFRYDMWTWARLAAGNSRPVFLYEFARVPAFHPHSPYAGLGATHGVEMAYVFGHLDPASAAWTKQDRALLDIVESYWTNFARTGNPNGEGLPRWPGFNNARELVVLDTRVRAAQVPDTGILSRIGYVYGTASVVLSHLLLFAILALALVIAPLVFIARFAIRRFRPRRAREMR